MRELSIVAIVGVYDECELIERCIVHLESLGVAIVVIDTGSTDGTLDILTRFVAEGRLHLITYSASRSEDFYYLDHALLYAKTTFDPDWVFFLDADEFWCPIAPLRELLADTQPCAFVAERYNACVTPYLLEFLTSTASTAFDPTSVDVHVEDLTLSSAMMRAADAPAWIAGRDPGKVLVAPDLVSSLGKGAHWIKRPDHLPLMSNTTNAIVIVHVPFSTFGRFKRKVRNAEAVLRDSLNAFPGETAWHWKRWIEIARAGGLREEYDLQVSNPDTLLQLQLGGKVKKASELLTTGQLAETQIPHPVCSPLVPTETTQVGVED